MRDHLLFAIVPYAAAVVAVTAMTARLVAPGREEDATPDAAAHRGGIARLIWSAALGLTALAHAIGLLFPDAVLFWTRDEVRLVALEIEGIAAGALALGGLMAVLARAVRRNDGTAHATADVMALTLVAVSMTSGLLMAIVYRWASAWAEVTLVPYLYSIARLDPATGLVTRLPALVKLHVGSAFVLIAIVPFTSLGGRLAALAADRVRAALRPARLRPAYDTAERWTAARVRTAAAVMFGNGEEEN